MGGLSSKTPPPEKKAKTKRDDPEKKFSDQIYKSILALEQAWDHNYDDVGQVIGTASRRPADREVVWQGRHFLMELKSTSGPTLQFSSFNRGRDNRRHQVKTLIKQHAAGGFGLVLVHQAPGRCWVIQAPALEAAGLQHEETSGSFVLGPPMLEVFQIPHPKGFKGLCWDLRTLFWNLMEARDGC